MYAHKVTLIAKQATDLPSISLTLNFKSYSPLGEIAGMLTEYLKLKASPSSRISASGMASMNADSF